MCYNSVTSSYHFVFFKNFTPPDKHSLTAPPQPLPEGERAPPPTPPLMEGSEYPCFLLENRAQRPCSTMVCLVIRDAN